MYLMLFFNNFLNNYFKKNINLFFIKMDTEDNYGNYTADDNIE